MIFKRRRRDSTTQVLEGDQPELDERSPEQIFEEITELEGENRAEADRERERRIVRLRHRAGARIVGSAGPRPEQPSPDYGQLAERPPGSLPEVEAAELSPELLRAGILRDGCLLVRNLAPRAIAEVMARDIERAFEEQATLRAGGTVDQPYYQEFEPDPSFGVAERQWVRDGGGVLAADCPKLMFNLIELFERAGIRGIVTDYLGERAAISVNKSTLRRARPDGGPWGIVGAWHQDGAFMGDVRALNIWLSLSHCGDVAPGLEVVPKRIDRIVPTGTEGSIFEWSVSPQVVLETAGREGTVGPIFEPGDAMIFDELCLHTTGFDPRMTNTRFAVETWFFGPSAFPSDYVPLAF